MVRRSCWKNLIGCLAVAVLVAFTNPVAAGEFTFDIPQLVGDYLGDITAMPTVDVVVDLGIDFVEIESASLQLSGRHTLGLLGDLNSSNTFALPAEIMARFDGPDLFSDVFIDELLPGQSGAFDFDETFRVGHFANGPPDYSPWLDGVAEFRFTVATPPTIAIYYLIDMPSVTINTATLTILGEADLDTSIVPPDFDSDGDVDGRDFLVWQRNPGMGELTDWQANYGSGSVSASEVVPEANGLAMAAMGMTLVFQCQHGRRRRRELSFEEIRGRTC